MSFRESVLHTAAHIRTTPLRFTLWFGTFLGSDRLYRSDWLPPRNSLPDPLDVQDHIGNVPDSLLYSGIGTLGVCAVLSISAERSTIRRTALGAALAIGVVANAVAEIKFGQQLFGLEGIAGSTYVPDQSVADFVYGTTAAVAAGALIASTEDRSFVPEQFADSSSQIDSQTLQTERS